MPLTLEYPLKLQGTWSTVFFGDQFFWLVEILVCKISVLLFYRMTDKAVRLHFNSFQGQAHLCCVPS